MFRHGRARRLTAGRHGEARRLTAGRHGGARRLTAGRHGGARRLHAHSQYTGAGDFSTLFMIISGSSLGLLSRLSLVPQFPGGAWRSQQVPHKTEQTTQLHQSSEQTTQPHQSSADRRKTHLKETMGTSVLLPLLLQAAFSNLKENSLRRTVDINDDQVDQVFFASYLAFKC